MIQGKMVNESDVENDSFRLQGPVAIYQGNERGKERERWKRKRKALKVKDTLRNITERQGIGVARNKEADDEWTESRMRSRSPPSIHTKVLKSKGEYCHYRFR